MPSKAGSSITLQGGISTLSAPLIFELSMVKVAHVVPFVASYRWSLYEIALICVVMFAFAVGIIVR